MNSLTVAAAAAPKPSWAGILSAVTGVITAICLITLAAGVVLANRRNTRAMLTHQRETILRLEALQTSVGATIRTALSAQLRASRIDLDRALEQSMRGSPTAEVQVTLDMFRTKVDEIIRAMDQQDAVARSVTATVSTGIAETARA